MLKKILAAFAALLLTAGLSVVAVAAPAFAHTGDLNASAVCNTATGNYDVTYKLTIASTSLNGTTYWRTGTTSFESTPTSNAGLTNGPVASTGAGVYTLGTISIPGTSTKAPWAYAFTTWTDNYTKGSDGGDIPLSGTCKIPDVPVSVGLTYIQSCAVDTTNTWRVRNPSGTTITISWHNASNTLSGTHSAAPGDTFFDTPRSTETMIISWGGGSSGVVAGSATKASGVDIPATDPACLPLDATGTFSFTPASCEAQGSYTLSGAVNATFTVSDGTTTQTGLGNGGPFPAEAGKTYTITVVPDSGHALTDSTTKSGSYEFVAPTGCVVQDATGSFTFSPPTCYAGGSYTLSGAVNATFTVSDGTTTQTGLGNGGPFAAVTGKTYTITVVPNSGHSLTGGTTASDSRLFTSPTNCVGIDTDPTASSCTATDKDAPYTKWIRIELDSRVIYTIGDTNPATDDDVVVTAEYTQVPVGTYTVKAVAAAGYVLIPTAAQKWTLTVQDTAKCDLPTEGLSVPTYTFVQTTCTAPGSYTVGASINPEFVEWREQGSNTVIPFNTKIVVDPARTVTLEATSTDPVKHGLQAPGGGDWTNPIVLKFVAATGCDLQLTTLALTGLGSGLGLTLAGGLVFLGIGGLLVFARRRQLTNN